MFTKPLKIFDTFSVDVSEDSKFKSLNLISSLLLLLILLLINIYYANINHYLILINSKMLF